MPTFQRFSFLIFGLLLQPFSAFSQVENKDFLEQESFFRHLSKQIQPGENKATRTSDFPGYDVHFYGLDLTIDPASRFISGFADVGLRLTESRSSITLALAAPLSIDSTRSAGFSVTSTLPDARGLRNFSFSRSLPADTLVTLRIFYRGFPDESYSSIRFGTFGGSPIVWTLSEPYGAMFWFPNKNVPSDKADSVHIAVTVPAPLVVASQGKLLQRTSSGGFNRFIWKSNYPIANYLLSIAVADYQEFTQFFKWQNDSMPVMNFWYKSGNLATLQTQNRVTIRQLELFSQQFGRYPFFEEKYGHAQFTFSGGMEHQTISSMASLGEGLSAHELMHQWFGDAITCARWEDIWINEGFATYGEGLWIEESRGETSFSQWRIAQQNSALGAPNGTVIPTSQAVDFLNPSHVNTIFNYRLSYVKAGVVVDMLRYLLGDEEFFRIFTKMVQETWRFKSITTPEFEAFVESESGKELSWFFDQWLVKSGFPSFLVNWEATPAGNSTFTTAVRIAQTGSASVPFFRMPLELLLSNGIRDTTLRIEPTQADQIFQISLSWEPTTLQFDPNARVLKTGATVVRRSVSETPGSLPTQTRLLSIFPNPFNPTSRIRFELRQPSSVSLSVMDISGREIAVRSLGTYSAGTYEAGLNGISLSSGVYLLVLKAGNVRSFRKVTVLK